MNKLVSSLLSLAFMVSLGGTAAIAQEDHAATPAGEHAEAETPHYPLKHPKSVEWSFAGPFGHYDLSLIHI